MRGVLFAEATLVPMSSMSEPGVRLRPPFPLSFPSSSLGMMSLSLSNTLRSLEGSGSSSLEARGVARQRGEGRALRALRGAEHSGARTATVACCRCNIERQQARGGNAVQL